MRDRSRLWMALVATAFLIVLGAVVACQPAAAPTVVAPVATQPAAAPAEPQAFANPQLLVSTDWLTQHLTDADVRVVDARSPEDYQAGHVPGAVSIPPSDTFDPDGPKGIVGPPDQIAQLFGGLGINDEAHVVIYGEGSDNAAARVFWTLEYYGHPNVSVLDGGFTKWQAEEREATADAPEVTPVTFEVEPRPELLATMQEILDKLDDDSVAFVDARSAEEYSGRDVRAKRGGHIPGAVHVDWRESFTSGDVPVFKTPAELAQLYADTGVSPEVEVHAY